jgi:hypothetical protein
MADLLFPVRGQNEWRQALTRKRQIPEALLVAQLDDRSRRGELNRCQRQRAEVTRPTTHCSNPVASLKFD